MTIFLSITFLPPLLGDKRYSEMFTETVRCRHP